MALHKGGFQRKRKYRKTIKQRIVQVSVRRFTRSILINFCSRQSTAFHFFCVENLFYHRTYRLWFTFGTIDWNDFVLIPCSRHVLFPCIKRIGPEVNHFALINYHNQRFRRNIAWCDLNCFRVRSFKAGIIIAIRMVGRNTANSFKPSSISNLISLNYSGNNKLVIHSLLQRTIIRLWEN